MVSAPAFCESCGSVFPSDFAFDGVVGVTLEGCTSGPCPNCGGMGHVPDGLFNFIGNTIQVLAAPERTFEQLTKLSAIVREAREKNLPSNVVVERIRREVPAFASLGDLLPKSRADLYGFLGVLLAAAALVMQFSQGTQESSSVNINIEQIIVETYDESRSNQFVELGRGRSHEGKPGRNATCPCGSGKKFKMCHGATL